MRIAIIGAGGIAQKGYFPLLTIWPGVEIVSLFSRTQERVTSVCSEWKISNGTTDIQDVLKAKPDAAFILTNNATHFEFCKLMMENDIDVFSEKPLSDSSAQSYELARLADQHQRILCVGFNRRYALLYRQAKELFGSRRIQLAVIQKHRTNPPHTSLYNNYLDDTIHQIDLLRFLCGEVEVVSTTYDMKDGMLHGAASMLNIPKGGQAVLMTSLMAGEWQESATLHGDGLTVHVDAFRELRMRYEDHEVVYGTDRPGKWVPELRERGFQGQIEHFFDCIRTRQTPLTSALEAARSQELMEKMVKASGDEIELPSGDWDQVSRWDNTPGTGSQK